MRKISCISFAAALFQYVISISLADAFKSDWIQYNHGNLSSFVTPSSDSLVALTDMKELIKVNFNHDEKIQWAVDLRGLENFDSIATDKNEQVVYLFSQSDSVFHSYNFTNGVLLKRFVTPSPVAQVESFFDKGVLFSCADGSLFLLDVAYNVKQLDLGFKVGNFHHSYVDGLVYIVTDEGDVGSIDIHLSTKPCSVNLQSYTSRQNKVSDFKGTTILTNHNDVLTLKPDSLHKISSKFGKKDVVRLLTADLIYTITSGKITFYSIDNENTNEMYTSEIKEPFSLLNLKNDSPFEGVAIKSGSGLKVLDLSDFSDSHDPTLIRSFEFETNISNNESVFSSYRNDETLLHFISTEDNGVITRKTFNLNRGTQTSETIRVGLPYNSIECPIVIDFPAPESKVDESLHLFQTEGSLISRWLYRLKRHLSQLGQSVALFRRSGNFPRSNDDSFSFNKIIVFFDNVGRDLMAASTKDGSSLWKVSPEIGSQKLVKILENNNGREVVAIFGHSYHVIDSTSGHVLSSESIRTEIVDALQVRTTDNNEIIALVLANDKQLLFMNPNAKLSPGQYVVKQIDAHTISGYEVSETLAPTWSFKKDNEEILLLSHKPKESVTSSIGIARADDTILYKYLYPNLLSVITKVKSDGTIKFYLIDSITGELLYLHSHDDSDFLVQDSLKIVMDDNWIVYVYLTSKPKIEQRIVVLDLFADKEKAASKEVSVFNESTEINTVSKLAFVYPEVISELASTRTKQGVTLKSILFLTKSGNIYEIPKFMLNSRRVANREMTASDFQDDFRMMPYDPVINRNTYQALNHKHLLKVASDGNHILVKPTLLESTAAVCLLNNYNFFCTKIHPSLSYDTLSTYFDKVKFFITIIGLLIAYIATKSFLVKKCLNAQWIK
ncbi:Piso0_005666 [Millerozyma farinosa CBS 7064]|uniref:ER membrane protein complex subunit 1 n=1 Tax=Pichia sorbitophila (strain ATCC MYA-4447 / BCRC 22081 / CBS 7064 / NBRC 10061 / NRRL Y-12695) TaxID=559304 RepID=G8Y2L1_PICSO|nr:Piso0_005666 [Millerozyma farinosa CBS 7064]